MPDFEPTRTAALDRLAGFLPRAGVAYARNRNHDLPGHGHVSGLSPYLRHAMLTEAEVLRAVLGAHGATAAAKFIDEVYWRTYWKGWLELRPAVWAQYRRTLKQALDTLQTQAGMRRTWEDACTGQTGIAGFDDWARELVQTGYMHNHARMWFASIWVFTLRLPWELGADFFLRHLLDGDPASNTLSWRWVAGLHTPGKTYLARTDNIANYTGGRFAPEGLAAIAPPPRMPPHPAPRPVPMSGAAMTGLRTALLITEEDMSPHWLLPQMPPPVAVAVLQATPHRSPLEVAEPVRHWVQAALTDAVARFGAEADWLAGAEGIVDWARRNNVRQIVTSYVPTGPTQEAMADLAQTLGAAEIALVQMIRPDQAAAWPRATHGFFKFREAIPKLLAAL